MRRIFVVRQGRKPQPCWRKARISNAVSRQKDKQISSRDSWDININSKTPASLQACCCLCVLWMGTIILRIIFSALVFDFINRWTGCQIAAYTRTSCGIDNQNCECCNHVVLSSFELSENIGMSCTIHHNASASSDPTCSENKNSCNHCSFTPLH